MILSSPLAVLADTPGGSQGVTTPVPKPGGAGYTPSAGIFDDYGFRVTITTNQPMKDAGIQLLAENFTEDDIKNQRNEIQDIMRRRYWEPGDYGIKSNQARKGKFSFLAITIFGDISFQVRAVKDKPCFFKILDSSHFLG